MTDTKKADAPQPQAELSEDQLDAAVGGVVGGSLADGRYRLTTLASQVSDGTSNTILFGERVQGASASAPLA